MIVVDANVLIAFLEHGHVHGEAALDILDTEDELMIHPLTLAECAVGAGKAGVEDELRAAISRIGIQVWEPDSEHPYRLGAARAASALKIPDCCVLDAADHLSATLATFDTALATASKSKGLTVLTL
ncbi:MAG: PIN domain-containing protein [Bifidobacteriaceae bacterium]|jgi:predicted nucleic acid-binding protein|nr:PIN domain-containing protein [Bifidobacteriaceae bacterium]